MHWLIGCELIFAFPEVVCFKLVEGLHQTQVLSSSIPLSWRTPLGEVLFQDISG